MSVKPTLGQPEPAPTNLAQTAQPGQPSPRPSRVRTRRIVGLVVVLALVGIAIGIWRYWKTPEAVLDPPFPDGIQEQEIVVALQKKRDEVLAKPKSADAWGEYGMLLIAHLYDRQADICFAEAARLNPNDPRWPYTRGHIALKKDPPNAEGLLRQAIATTGKGEEFRSTARLLLAEWLLEKGNLDEAEKLFAEELGPPPGRPRAAYGLGMVAVARGDEARATTLMTPLLKDDHVKKQANVYLARFARSRGDEEAAARYERAAVQLPEPFAWPDPMYDVIPTLAVGRRGRERMINFLEQRHKYAEAIEAYQTELEIERTPKNLLGAGINYVRIKDYNRGIALIREAVERDPDSPTATYTLALSMFTWAEIEIDRNPQSAEARKWFEEVIVQSKRTTSLKPDHAKAYLYWGLSLKHLGKAEEAIGPLRKGLISKPEYIELNLALGQVLLQTGNKAEAETYLKHAQELDPDDRRPQQELDKLHGKKP